MNDTPRTPKSSTQLAGTPCTRDEAARKAKLTLAAMTVCFLAGDDEHLSEEMLVPLVRTNLGDVISTLEEEAGITARELELDTWTLGAEYERTRPAEQLHPDFAKFADEDASGWVRANRAYSWPPNLDHEADAAAADQVTWTRHALATKPPKTAFEALLRAVAAMDEFRHWAENAPAARTNEADVAPVLMAQVIGHLQGRQG